MAFAMQLVALPECCARHGLSRGMRVWAYRQAAGHHTDAAIAAARLLVAAHQSILRVAWCVRMSIANVERLHKLGKGILSSSKGRMSMAQLCAGSVNVRAHRRFQADAQALESVWAPLAAGAASAPLAGPYSLVRRQLSPIEVFIKRKLAEAKGDDEGGPAPKPCPT